MFKIGQRVRLNSKGRLKFDGAEAVITDMYYGSFDKGVWVRWDIPRPELLSAFRIDWLEPAEEESMEFDV